MARDRSPADFIPYARHVDAETILTHDGLLLTVIAIDGFPAETADDSELAHRRDVRDLALRTLGSSEWAVMAHVLRRPAPARIDAPVVGAYAAALDARYTGALTARRLFEDRHFLTLIRRPLQGHVGLLEEFARLARGAGSSESARHDRAADLRAIREAARTLLA
ncbi:MAG: type IV secretion system protein VirB4, partial [Alphaproteobacteria bacterium]